ncbi:MAG TPA: hypothetical protein VG102_03720, partial [Candidatus Paceibacterota bacterium]|nr:hypothetical protein [Candidatus Paceibacterota bacterium]
MGQDGLDRRKFLKQGLAAALATQLPAENASAESLDRNWTRVDKSITFEEGNAMSFIRSLGV